MSGPKPRAPNLDSTNHTHSLGLEAESPVQKLLFTHLLIYGVELVHARCSQGDIHQECRRKTGHGPVSSLTANKQQGLICGTSSWGLVALFSLTNRPVIKAIHK